MSKNVYGPLPVTTTKKETTSEGWSKVYGLNYPMGTLTTGGYLAKQSGLELVKSNLTQLLRTEKGERVMLPNYGITLRKYLFEPLDEQLFNEVKEEIITAVRNYAPNVQILKISVNPLDKFGVESLQALQIKLTCKLTENPNILFDVKVKVG